MNDEQLLLLRKALKIGRYSEFSISNYVSAINKYISCKGFNFSEEVLITYFHEMRLNDYSTSTLRMALMAVKLYLKLIENRGFENSLLKELKREYKLPDALSKSEVKSMLDNISNLKLSPLF